MLDITGRVAPVTGRNRDRRNTEVSTVMGKSVARVSYAPSGLHNATIRTAVESTHETFGGARPI